MSHRKTMQSTQTLPDNVADAFKQGNKAEAVKLPGDATGLELKKAKDAVESAAAGRSQRCSRYGKHSWRVMA